MGYKFLCLRYSFFDDDQYAYACRKKASFHQSSGLAKGYKPLMPGQRQTTRGRIPNQMLAECMATGLPPSAHNPKGSRQNFQRKHFLGKSHETARRAVI